MAQRASVATGSLYDRGERLRVAGVGTWVVRAGPRGGVPVVLLHGIPTSAYLYREVMHALHEEHDCIAFDWPGFGSSDKPTEADATHRARAHHLGALLDALGLERVHLVVHDLGGPAGILYAVEHPERVASLVVLNTTLYRRDYRPPLPALAQFVPILREATRPLFTRGVFERFFKRGLARPQRMPREVLDSHWRLAKSRGGLGPILDAWAQVPDGAESVREARARMGSFPRPVLVLFGAEDPYLPPVNAERFAKDFPHAELHLLPGVGHFLQEDAPEDVAERISAFLRRHA